MKAQEEVRAILDVLATKFPNFIFKYWIDKIDDDHIIEVYPSDFEESKRFINEEYQILTSFYSKFPEESLTFLKEEDLLFKEDLELITSFNYTRETVASIDIATWFNFKVISKVIGPGFNQPITTSTPSYPTYNLAA